MPEMPVEMIPVCCELCARSRPDLWRVESLIGGVCRGCATRLHGFVLTRTMDELSMIWRVPGGSGPLVIVPTEGRKQEHVAPPVKLREWSAARQGWVEVQHPLGALETAQVHADLGRAYLVMGLPGDALFSAATALGMDGSAGAMQLALEVIFSPVLLRGPEALAVLKARLLPA